MVRTRLSKSGDLSEGNGEPQTGRHSHDSGKTYSQAAAVSVSDDQIKSRSNSKGNALELDLDTGNSGSVFADQEVVPCRVCRVECSATDKAISCDMCEGWVHFKCSNLSKSEYDFIGKTEGKTGIRWYCHRCEHTMRNENPIEIITKQSIKIDNLTEQVRMLQQGLTEVISLVKGKRHEDRNLEETVQNQVSEKIDDVREKEAKKSNIILFGVPEPTSRDTEKEEDLKTIRNIVLAAETEEGVVAPLDSNRITRLGGRKEGSVRPRPLRVTFDTPEEKWTVVNRSRKIKSVEAYKDVTIQSDKTKKELQEDRKLKAECSQKRKDTGQDYIIFAQEIMLRDEVENFKKLRQQKRANENK